jgi:hypothetical protein
VIDSRDSRSRDGRRDGPKRDLRNFFLRRKAVTRTAILRVRARRGKRCQGLCARAHTFFSASQKRPFRRRFCDCTKIARMLRGLRAAHAAQSHGDVRRRAPSARATSRRTRFVNAEAVFFVVL